MSFDPIIAEILGRELNPEQLSAASLAPGQSLRIIAGPGTGKTKTLAYRFLALTAGHGLRPDNVLALTFTDKAAAEMRERVRLLLPAGSRLWISTFHSFAMNVLLDEVAIVRDKAALTNLLNPLDLLLLQAEISQQILAEPNLAELYPTLDFVDGENLLRDTFAAIERLRDAYQSPEDVRAKLPPNPVTIEERTRRDVMALTAHVYTLYRNRLLERAMLDFPELVYRAYYALKLNPALCERYHRRFAHILVDEFQDTSLSQLEFLRLLSPQLDNLTVVGDRKQSIYGWRNARPENFEEAALLKSAALALTRNYRSRQEILDAAASVLHPLSGENGRIAPAELALQAHNSSSGETPAVVVARPADSVPKEATLEAEAAFIAREIKYMREQPGGAEKSIAILLRSVRTGSKPYEEALRKAGIEYVTVGGDGYYDQAEVLNLIALLRLLCDPDDGQAFFRLATSPLFRISNAALMKIAELTRREGAYSEDKGPRMETGAEIYIETVPPDLQQKTLTALLELLRNGRAELRQRSPAALVKWILESELYQRFFATRPPGQRAQIEANCQKLLQLAADFEKAQPEAGLPELAAYLTLWAESDLPEAEATPDEEVANPNIVQLMTVHQSKGLEFDVVFVPRQRPYVFRPFGPGNSAPGFVYMPGREDLFHAGFAVLNCYDPEKQERIATEEMELYKKIEGARAVEEERYILYVAMTRARSRLYLTAAFSAAQEKARPPKNFFFREVLAWAETAQAEGHAVKIVNFEPIIK